MIQQTQLTHTPIPRKRWKKTSHLEATKRKKNHPVESEREKTADAEDFPTPHYCARRRQIRWLDTVRVSAWFRVFPSFSFSHFQAASAPLASALFAHNFPNKSLLLDSASRSVCSVLLGVKLAHAGGIALAEQVGRKFGDTSRLVLISSGGNLRLWQLRWDYKSNVCEFIACFMPRTQQKKLYCFSNLVINFTDIWQIINI